jgi:hypothetical protein
MGSSSQRSVFGLSSSKAELQLHTQPPLLSCALIANYTAHDAFWWMSRTTSSQAKNTLLDIHQCAAHACTVFFVVQGIVSALVALPYDQGDSEDADFGAVTQTNAYKREHGMLLLREALLSLACPASKYCLLRHVVSVCPHRSIKGILIDCVKDNVQNALIFVKGSTCGRRPVDLVPVDMAITEELLGIGYLSADPRKPLNKTDDKDAQIESLMSMEAVVFSTCPPQSTLNPLWSMHLVTSICNSTLHSLVSPKKVTASLVSDWMGCFCLS